MWSSSPSTSSGPLSPEPRIVSITESEWSKVALSADEDELLRAAGTDLARGTDRYGAADSASLASLIHVRGQGPTAEVRIADAVGLVAIPTLHLHVRPKIPVSHLLYILERAHVVPRFAIDAGLLDASDNLAVLVSHWYVTALERVLEEGLARDYRQEREELTSVRGRLLALDTARLYYRGRAAVVADYEEFDFDTPLNRLIAHAVRLVAAGSALPDTLRRRAVRAAKRMDGVGIFRPADALAQTDRRTSYYGSARELALQILAHTGRTLGSGEARSWTFLIRTPAPVEAGIRALIAERLRDLVVVRRASMRVPTGNLTINPDLVFDRAGGILAIGDVKYKLTADEWNRSDLYEVIAFAAGFGVLDALVGQFSGAPSRCLMPVQIGEHTVTQVTWPAADDFTAEAAAEIFTEGVRSWYLGHVHSEAGGIAQQIPA